MPIKSFRGLIADGVQDTIVLHTNTGSTGYRIVKLQLMSNDYGTATPDGQNSLVKIFKVSQTTIDETLDFSDNTLLAAASFERTTSTATFSESTIFDNEIFNQDIYVVHKDFSSGEPVNYYIELEQIKLDLTENTVATLKDIRNIEAEYL
jgi:hypothetical protein